MLRLESVTTETPPRPKSFHPIEGHSMHARFARLPVCHPHMNRKGRVDVPRTASPGIYRVGLETSAMTSAVARWPSLRAMSANSGLRVFERSSGEEEPLETGLPRGNLDTGDDPRIVITLRAAIEPQLRIK